MGSFVVRSIFSTPRYSRRFDGFVFSSTMGPNPAVGMGKFLASMACVFGGAKKKNKLLSYIAFGTYTKRIKDPRTSYDWLSTVPEEVQKYIDDPMCGFYFTGEGFKTLFGLIAFMQSEEAYALIPDRPCFFTYGSEDPVGSYAAGVETHLKGKPFDLVATQHPADTWPFSSLRRARTSGNGSRASRFVRVFCATDAGRCASWPRSRW